MVDEGALWEKIWRQLKGWSKKRGYCGLASHWETSKDPYVFGIDLVADSYVLSELTTCYQFKRGNDYLPSTCKKVCPLPSKFCPCFQNDLGLIDGYMKKNQGSDMSAFTRALTAR